MEVYGTAVPPAVPIDQLSLPTGLFIGSYDKLATVADNEWLVSKINADVLKWHQVYPLGHLSFTLAKDMTYFREDVMNLVGQYATNSFATDSQETTFLTN